MRRNFKRFLGVTLAAAMTVTAVPGVTFAADVKAEAQEAEKVTKNDNLLRLWYEKPATDWETEALAIGNGYMGGLVFGGVAKEKVHLNEKTIWKGGPGSVVGDWKYGNTNATEKPEHIQTIKNNLESIRAKLDDKSKNVFGYSEASYEPSGTSTKGEAMEDLNKLMSGLDGYSSPQDFADLFITTEHTDSGAKNYVRDLDMRTGLATVNYDFDGVHYTREYFNSYPDNVLVAHLTADQKGKITFAANLKDKTRSQDSYTAEGNTITMHCEMFNNGELIEGQLRVINNGGTIEAVGDSITVTGADSATLIFACGTDYKMEIPTFKGDDPHAVVTERLEAAAAKGYEELKKAHVADHSGLFSRMELGFNEEVPQIPTDELIKKYRNLVDKKGGELPTESEQRALEIMCYQFGRYLTIAGSRPGTLPTNLQGVWGEDSFPWGGDYHFNINVQMNYWPTMASNLDECLLPFNDYLSVLRVAGREAAASAFGIKSNPGEENGWLVGCFSTPYMYTTMGQKYNAAGWNPTGSAWALLNSYEYYLYTGDQKYLEELYPSMKEVANFWNEALYWSEYQQRWVSAPSYSPENGPIVNGASYDQQFIWQHFENTIQAAKILGKDEELIAQWKEKQDKLNPVIVGDSGQVKEWFEETTFGKAKAGNLEEIDIPLWRESLGAQLGGQQPPHRHLSHLMALYPGNMINKDNPTFMDAAVVSLEERGLDATGWSKAHKLNLWARAGRSEEAFQIVQSAVGGGNSGFLTNMFSSHGGGANYKGYPIFQIDGNYGYTAGVNEMLIQSQLGYTQFLPAIPKEWNNGFVNGIVARGNFVIDMEWSDGTADKFAVTSRNGGTFIGEYNKLSECKVKTADGKPVEVKVENENKISFPTEKGQKYVIDFHSNSDKLQGVVDRAKEASAKMTDEVLATQKAVLDAAIKEAEQVIAKNETAKYQKMTVTLSKKIELAELAIVLKDKYNEAKAVYDGRNVDETWARYIAKAEALNKQLAAVVDLLKNDKVTKSELTLMADAIDAKKQDFLTVKDQIVVTFTPNGGQAKPGDKVTITSSEPDLTIRYTTDENDPMPFSAEYKEPFALENTPAVVKAALFLGERQISDVFSVSFAGSIQDATDLAPTHSTVTDDGNSEYADASAAVDGMTDEECWYPSKLPAVLTLEFAQPIKVDTAEILLYKYSSMFGAKLTDFNIEYWDGNAWVPALEHASMDGIQGVFTFDEFTSNKVRLYVKGWTQYKALDAFRLFSTKKPVVSNKGALEFVINVAQKKVDDGTVAAAIPTVQESFNKVFEYAKAVNQRETSNQDSIDRTAAALLGEIEKLGLVAGDKTSLNEHYTMYSALNLDLYIDGAEKEAFGKALEAAKAVLDDANALEAAVVEADKALLDAAKALVKKADKAALQKLVDEASALKQADYMTTGWEVFAKALTSAKAVLADKNAVQADADAEVKLLAQAMSLLEKKADKTALEAQIKEAQATELKGFSKEKVKAFKAALKAAEDVFANETLSEYQQPIVDAAVKDLKEAMENLKAPEPAVELPFKDVAKDAWYKDAVEFVYTKKIMTGLDNMLFGPDEALARAQFAVILHRMNKAPSVEFKEKFADVAEGQWYTDAVLWANEIGVVTGYSDTKMFGPADEINREQMAVMMYRYALHKEYDTTTKAELDQFEDAKDVNAFAKEAMQWAVGKGIITGKDNGTRLDPQGNATRAECATIIMRFVQKNVK